MGKPDAVERLRETFLDEDLPSGFSVRVGVADMRLVLAYVAELERDGEIGVDYEEGYPRFAPFTHEIQEAVTPASLNEMVEQWKLDKARVAELEGALRTITESVCVAEFLSEDRADCECPRCIAEAALTGGEKGGG